MSGLDASTVTRSIGRPSTLFLTSVPVTPKCRVSRVLNELITAQPYNWLDGEFQNVVEHSGRQKSFSRKLFVL